jgi:polyhydroxybutyrate depolymerase
VSSAARPTPGDEPHRQQHDDRPDQHGTRDPIVPYDGGVASLFGWRPRGTGLSAAASADYYATRNGISTGPTEPAELPHRAGSRGTWVSRQRHQQTGKSPVELYTVHGGGHVVPNNRKRALRLLGRTTQDIDTGELLWAFASSSTAPPVQDEIAPSSTPRG